MNRLFEKVNKYWIIGIIALILTIFSYWFFNKFFPVQAGVWLKNNENNFDESVIPNSGWLASLTGGENNYFWTTMEFPGKQNVCLDIYSKTKISQNLNFRIPAIQAPRANFYPEAGTLSDFFSQMTPTLVEENIRQSKPYYIGHLGNNITREGKDIFFVGENEKFLIPTKAIFSKHFPTKETPSLSAGISSLPYANVLVNLPEGILLSDGQGVFVMNQGKLFLIRSPEVFESMGYKWENIKQMDNYEKTFNAYLSGNLIDFNTVHPNGTILKNNSELYLVWNMKLYKLTSEEQSEFFPEQPVVEIFQNNLPADCSEKSDSNRITCCVSNMDTRLNPPNYSPFLNTIKWDLSQVANEENTEKINWRARIVINKENSLRRLGSLKNFVLYGLGILK